MPQLILKDGAEIDYDDMGLGYPVLFIHGWGMSKDAFWLQSNLADECRVIIPSLRGCGQSTIGNKPLSIQTIGEDIFEFASLLDLREFILVGWSMGAISVWNANTNKDLANVRNFVSIDMSPKIINSKNWDLGIIGSKDLSGEKGQGYLEKLLLNMTENWAVAAKRTADKILAINQSKEIEEEIIPRLLEIADKNNSHNMAILWADLVKIDAREKIKTFIPQTYVVRGMQSALYSPQVGEFVASQLPAATLVDFNHSGHSPHLEEYEKFNSMIISLVNEASEFLKEGVSANK